MLTFLTFATAVLFIAGILLLVSPGTIKKVSDILSKNVFSIDERMPDMRKPLGIIFLILAILLWYIVLRK